MKKFYLNIFFVFLAIVLLSQEGFTKEYYVDNVNGNNSNIGDKENPFKSISQAMAIVESGETVIIIANSDDMPYTESIIIEKSGCDGSLITIRGESSDRKPVINGGNTETILNCYGKHHILIKDLVFKDTNKQGLGFAKACNNITLENLEIYDCEKNGILVNDGGYDFKILNCTIRRIGNSGIALMGSKENKLNETVVEGCVISDVYSNDGITLHKDEDGNDLGAHHIIRNNNITKCAEQGIDITGGEDVLVEKNTTSENNDSGILIDHEVTKIKISHHTSLNEIRFGIIVQKSNDISISNSSFKGAFENTVIQIVDSKNLIIDNNIFEATSGSCSRKIVDFSLSSEFVTENVVFSNNTFLASEGNDSEGMMLRFLGKLPEKNSVKWDCNQWFNHKNNQKVFYDPDNEIYSFPTFKEKYAPNDTFCNPSAKSPSFLNIRKL